MMKMSQLFACSVLLVALCLVAVALSAPLASLTENVSGETKDVLSVLFNRPLPTAWKLPNNLLPSGNFGPCFQSCLQPGRTVSEIHLCSRQCLANAGAGISHG